MPFGLASASEVFQKRNEAAVDRIDDIHIMADDIIIAAATVEEHEMIFCQVLARARDCNVKFNSSYVSIQLNTWVPLSVMKELNQILLKSVQL